MAGKNAAQQLVWRDSRLKGAAPRCLNRCSVQTSLQYRKPVAFASSITCSRWRRLAFVVVRDSEGAVQALCLKATPTSSPRGFSCGMCWSWSMPSSCMESAVCEGQELCFWASSSGVDEACLCTHVARIAPAGGGCRSSTGVGNCAV